MFGAALPAGATPQHAQIVLAELGGLFLSDFTKLNYPSHLIQSAISFFMENATKPARQVTPRHRFTLPSELNNDWLAQLFANHLQALGGTQQQKQQFLNASLQWLDKLNKRLSSQQLGAGQGKPAQGSASPSNSNGMSDAEYNALYDYNEKMKPRTEGILRDKWGHAYQANLRMVDNYLQSLSEAEKRHFDTFLNNGLHALNDPTVILGLYGQAIGVNNIPRGGAELANEINLMHDAMKNNRKQWLADERMQSRYRELIRIRDGG